MQEAEGAKEHTELAPREVLRTEKDNLNSNYEVEFGSEEELIKAGEDRFPKYGGVQDSEVAGQRRSAASEESKR